jgi:hypothetical protein
MFVDSKKLVGVHGVILTEGKNPCIGGFEDNAAGS